MSDLPSQTSAISLFVNSIVLLPACQAQDLSFFILSLATRFHTCEYLPCLLSLCNDFCTCFSFPIHHHCIVLNSSGCPLDLCSRMHLGLSTLISCFCYFILSTAVGVIFLSIVLITISSPHCTFSNSSIF